MKARKSHCLRRAGLAVLFMLLSGCHTSGGRVMETAIERQSVWWHNTGDFAHLIIPRIVDPRSGVLHVYIEGDGKPWIKHRYIAKDPTPENPLAFRLMMRDPNNSLYLGRPCYFARFYNGNTESSNCDPTFWTSARYSEKVVDSMVAALEAVIATDAYSNVVLIGYSGGGTLAYLMAGRMEKIDRVITVAANLDHNAWTHYHGFSPLSGSLDPARTVIPQTVDQIHLRGAGDRNIPAMITENFVANDPENWVTFPAYDHICCWEENWPTILKSLIATSK